MPAPQSGHGFIMQSEKSTPQGRVLWGLKTAWASVPAYCQALSTELSALRPLSALPFQPWVQGKGCAQATARGARDTLQARGSLEPAWYRLTDRQQGILGIPGAGPHPAPRGGSPLPPLTSCPSSSRAQGACTAGRRLLPESVQASPLWAPLRTLKNLVMASAVCTEDAGFC